MDLALVVALLAVVVFWWRMASDANRPLGSESANAGTNLGEEAGTTLAPTSLPAADVTPAGETTSEANPPQVVEPGNPLLVEHQVQDGETLIGIANLYSVTVEEIKAANSLESDVIRAGDELLIPVPEVVVEGGGDQTVSTVFKYEVQENDAVVGIAVRFGSQVESILEANNLSPNDFIRPGQMLRVPVEQVPSAVLASSEAARNLPQTEWPVYEAPRLMGPQDEEALPSSEQILFRWISVDLLAENEWYVLRIWPLEGASELPPTIWTKATSYRLDTEWAPAGRSARYGWQVTVARVLPDLGDGREIQGASEASEVRTFFWQ